MVTAAEPTPLSRDELRKYLGRPVWPLSLNFVVNMAKRRGAPPSLVEMLNRLPRRWYKSERDLWTELQSHFDIVPHG